MELPNVLGDSLVTRCSNQLTLPRRGQKLLTMRLRHAYLQSMVNVAILLYQEITIGTRIQWCGVNYRA